MIFMTRELQIYNFLNCVIFIDIFVLCYFIIYIFFTMLGKKRKKRTLVFIPQVEGVLIFHSAVHPR